MIFSALTEYRSNASKAPCRSKLVTISLNRATTCRTIKEPELDNGKVNGVEKQESSGSICQVFSSINHAGSVVVSSDSISSYKFCSWPRSY